MAFLPGAILWVFMIAKGLWIIWSEKILLSFKNLKVVQNKASKWNYEYLRMRRSSSYLEIRKILWAF